MQGKTVLITGGTNGIGRAAAVALAKMGASVVIVGRNRERTAGVVREIQQAVGHERVEGLTGDLSLMAGVREVASAFLEKYDRLDVLLNNAGAIFQQRQVTSEGLEMTFALNHMSYFLLTHLLLGALKRSAAETGEARVISVSSGAHQVIRRFDIADAQSEKRYSSFVAYGRSKLMNVLFAYALARRAADAGIMSNALHPGAVGTGFGAGGTGVVNAMFSLMRPFMLTPEKGAETSIYLAASPAAKGVTSAYFEKSRPVRSSPESYSEQHQRDLWALSERIAGIGQPAGV
jgi:NAD(P)-dependent dehydrogenase (short-subunit alcohol dehydrogenase family)